MKQKLALSCTLIHTPRILILDEPTTGVDPVSRREFWAILHELLNEGVTILVSTPYMDEAQKCNRIAFMHKGRILAIDKPHALTAHFQYELIEIQSPDLYDTLNQLKNIPSIISSQLFGDKLHVTVGNFQTLKRELQEKKINISSIQKIEPSTEDIFIELMKK